MITKFIEKDFQRQVMMENMENTLLNTNANALAFDFNNTHCNEDVNVEVTKKVNFCVMYLT